MVALVGLEVYTVNVNSLFTSKLTTDVMRRWWVVGNNCGKHTVEFKTNELTHFHGLTSSDDVESSERGY